MTSPTGRSSQPIACLSLDLESDFSSRLPTAYQAWDAAKVDELMALLGRYQAPLTVFVVGAGLEARPEVVRRFRDRGAEFHLHSYSHDLGQPDSIDEIRRGTDAFTAFFGERPRGYRAPEGRISEEGWKRLSAEGFAFDASVFPSFWPAPRYLRYPRTPFRPVDGLVEIPFGVVSPLRVITSVSWIKLLGWPLYRSLVALERRLPDPLVVGMHMHDLWELPSRKSLGVPWTWIYGRNAARGLELLERFLKLLQGRGYRFTTLGAVARDMPAPPC